MPKKKAPAKESVGKKSGLASKTTTTLSEKKNDSTPELFGDPQHTLPKDLCAPRVWKAHETLVNGDDLDGFWEKSYPVTKEAWENLKYFLQHLCIKDLRKALKNSPQSITHPFIAQQILWWHHISTGKQHAPLLENVEREFLTKNAGKEQDDNLQSRKETTAKASKLLTELVGMFVHSLLPEYSVTRRTATPKKGGRPKRCEAVVVDDYGTQVKMPLDKRIVGEYSPICEDMVFVFHTHFLSPKATSEAKKKFWKWNRKKESEDAFRDRIATFIQTFCEISYDWHESQPVLPISQETVNTMITYSRREGNKVNLKYLSYILCAFGSFKDGDLLSQDILVKEAGSVLGMIRRNAPPKIKNYLSAAIDPSQI